MTVAISAKPTIVSVFGDSWTAPARDKAVPYVSDFIPAAAAGLGYVSGGANYLLARFAWGGVSSYDAVNGTGNFPLAIDSGQGTTFAVAAPHDFAKYQVFRYGINDILQALGANLDNNPARSDYATFTAQLAATGLTATHAIANATTWAAFKANIRAQMVSRFTSLCNSSKAVGRRPLLAKMPFMTPMATGTWNWTARHHDLMVEVNAAIDQAAAATGARVLNQTDNTLSAAQRVDYAHPNQEFAFLIGVDFGVKLRAALQGY